MKHFLAYLAVTTLLAVPRFGLAQTPPAAPSGTSPSGMPPAGMHPLGMSPSGMSPSGMSSSGMSPSGMPPAGMPPAGMPTQGMSPSGMSASGASPTGTPTIEPKAVAILKATCAALSGAKTMSFDALNTYEKAARNGQPLYYATLNHVTLERPNMLRVITPGDGVPDEFYYDGKAMTAYVPSQDLVAVAAAPPTLEQMLDTAWEKAAIYFPFADVIVSHPCDVFEKDGLNSAFYVGRSKVVGGTVTDMVAVTGDNIQAELWIGAEDHLPRLIRVVYPHEPAHALYQTEYSHWRLGEKFDPATFASAKAAKGHKMNFAPPGADQPKPGQPAPASGSASAPPSTAAPAPAPASAPAH